MRRAREERTCALHACEQRSCACALEGGRGGGGHLVCQQHSHDSIHTVGEAGAEDAPHLHGLEEQARLQGTAPRPCRHAAPTHIGVRPLGVRLGKSGEGGGGGGGSGGVHRRPPPDASRRGNAHCRRPL